MQAFKAAVYGVLPGLFGLKIREIQHYQIKYRLFHKVKLSKEPSNINFLSF